MATRKAPASAYHWNRERHVTGVAFPVRPTESNGTLERVHEFGHIKVRTGTNDDLVTVVFAGISQFVMTASMAKELGMALIAEGDRVAGR